MADSNILSDFGIKILEQEIDDVIFPVSYTHLTLPTILRV